jgi:hypothetical protein
MTLDTMMRLALALIALNFGGIVLVLVFLRLH